MERGERLYARWGWLAVFVTPAVVSGTAKMPPYGSAHVGNLLDALGWTVSVAASADGVGSPPAIAPGTTSPSWSGKHVALVAMILRTVTNQRGRGASSVDRIVDRAVGKPQRSGCHQCDNTCQPYS